MKMPTIAITRPKESLSSAVKLAKSYKFKTIAVPFIEIREKEDKQFSIFLKKLLNGGVDYVIFTSTNGIKFTLKKVIKAKKKKEFFKALKKIKVVAIGKITAKSLQKYKIKADILPEEFSSNGLVKKFAKQEIANKNIEIPRSNYGSDMLIEGLKKLNANVHEVHVYSIALPKNLEKQKKLIEKALKGEVDIFTFTSTQTVVNFLKIAEKKKEKIIKILNEKITACIGMPTKKILEENGIKVKVMPKEFTFEEMMKEIDRCLKNNSLYA